MKRLFQFLFLLPRESVANSAAAREVAVANAFAPDDSLSDLPEAGGWFKVSPYGTFPGTSPARPQHFNAEGARAMVAEFNSVLGRLGRLFRGIPIYRGHPDVDITIWPDDRRLGKIVELDARADGLWARAEWNCLGAENQREGFWIYPSPRWDSPAGQAKFAPDRLISVGLTNTPRIPTSEPAVHNSATDEASGAEPENEEINTEHITEMDPKLLREKLGLDVSCTDEECLAKIDSLMADAAQANQAVADKAAAETTAEECQSEKDELANSLAAERARANTALLDLALQRGAITAAQKPEWATKLADPSQREAAANSLAALAPKLNTQPLAAGQTRADREAVGNVREQVANAVAELQKTGMAYDEAWCSVKKRPEFATYFGLTSTSK